MPRRALGPGAAGTALALLGAACTGRTDGADAPFDRQFIDMMVPHHEGAIAMARIAETRGQHAEIKELAAAVVAGQGAEIRRLKAWRRAWYGSDQTPPMSRMPTVPGTAGANAGGHSGMAGMTMDMAADVAKLGQAPEPFDRAFIDAMIPHHESAVAAAVAAATRAQHAEIKELAAAIVRDQQREIAQMRQWRQAWYG
jgi:uncharacterized protein (DUF305 family)